MEIPLSHGKSALVDAEDYEVLSCWKWTFDGRYAQRNDHSTGKKLKIYMHRLLLNAPKGSIVDHINCNPLDNRKDNLRFVTASENARNALKWMRPCSSAYKGVTWHKASSKWMVQLKVHQKQIHGGLFLSEIEAASAYNKLASATFGEFAKLNEL